MPRLLNKRVHGVPPGAVLIDRSTKWGNPFKIGQVHNGRRLTREDAVEAHKDWFLHSSEGHRLQQDLPELRGKDLVCHCSPLRCHGQLLLETANED